MKQIDQDLFKQFKEFKPSKGDLRRQKIINVIIEAIAEEGLHEFNSKTIAERAKMIRSHVVYYFPNYQAMIQAAIHHVIVTGQEITVAHLAIANTPEEKVIAWVDGTFAWFERHPHHSSVMLLLHYLGSCDKKYAELNLKIQLGGYDRIRLILLSGAKKKNEKLAQDYALRFRAMIIGLLNDFFTIGKKVDYDTERKNARRIMLELAKDFWKQCR